MWTAILAILKQVFEGVNKYLSMAEYRSHKEAGRNEANVEAQGEVLKDVELVKELRDNVDAIPDDIMYPNRDNGNS